jgi:hypothetical protein
MGLYQDRSAWTTVLTFSYFRLGYFWPTPTYRIGLEVE